MVIPNALNSVNTPGLGRLGSGDILARFKTGQDEHALKLILRLRRDCV